MPKKLTTALCACALALTCAGLVGCAGQSAAGDVNAEVPEGAAPLMPVSHTGRYEALAAEGCYGCHGSSPTSEVLLATATPLPADHYMNAQATTYTVDALRAQCYTCHGQAVSEVAELIW